LEVGRGRLRFKFRRFRLGFRTAKRGHIGAGEQLDADGIMNTGGRIVEREPLSHLTGFYANRGVIAGVIARRAVEDFDSDGPFFEPYRRTVEGVFDDISKELLAALTCPELFGMEHPDELFADQFRRNFVFSRVAGNVADGKIF
jgi:hypothetical protein